MPRPADRNDSAFPYGFLLREEGYIECEGMTMRQWYSGMAMQGFLAGRQEPFHKDDVPNISRIAFEFADAMLAEQEKMSNTKTRTRVPIGTRVRVLKGEYIMHTGRITGYLTDTVANVRIDGHGLNDITFPAEWLEPEATSPS